MPIPRLTMYFLGTGDAYSEKKQDFICNYLYESTENFAVRFGGPGSGFAGKPTANFRNDLINEFLTGVPGAPETKDLVEITFGRTAAENVRVGFEFVDRLQPAQLVLVGHSRGACTCLYLANRIRRDIRDHLPRISLLLFDPVPGGADPTSKLGNWDLQSVSLPEDIVDDYVQFLAMHDNRYKMSEQVKFTRGKFHPISLVLHSPRMVNDEFSHRKLYIVPGNHTDLIKREEKCIPLSNITRSIAQKHLMEWGVDLREEVPRYDKWELLNWYEKIWENLTDYVNDLDFFHKRHAYLVHYQGNHFYTRLDLPSIAEVNFYGDVPVTSDRLQVRWVCPHHREVFALACPTMFDDIDEPIAKVKDQQRLGLIRGEVTSLKTRCRATYLRLQGQTDYAPLLEGEQKEGFQGLKIVEDYAPYRTWSGVGRSKGRERR
jgi:hypothetical protein